MSTPARPSFRGRRLARAIWRLTRIYWTSPEAKWGALLLAGAIALELVGVAFRRANGHAPRAMYRFSSLRPCLSVLLVVASFSAHAAPPPESSDGWIAFAAN